MPASLVGIGLGEDVATSFDDTPHVVAAVHELRGACSAALYERPLKAAERRRTPGLTEDTVGPISNAHSRSRQPAIRLARDRRWEEPYARCGVYAVSLRARL